MVFFGIRGKTRNLIISDVSLLLSLILFFYFIPLLCTTEDTPSDTEFGKNLCKSSDSDNGYCEEQEIEHLLSADTKSYVYHKAVNEKLSVVSLRDFKQEGKDFKILVHGFLSSCVDFEDNIIPAYLDEFPDLKVICIDWSKFANPKDGLAGYSESLKLVPNVAERLASLIEAMVKSHVVQDLSNVHIVGFSLGAHLAGITGGYVKKKLGRKVGRITGLDPAGPGFDTLSLNRDRLDKSDADFVDILHTCLGALGTSLKCGHVDFYVNDGRHQPHCMAEQDPMKKLAETFTGDCSHRSAQLYYARSIRARNMVACDCNSYIDYKNGKCSDCTDDFQAILGEHCNTKSRGSYFVDILL